MGGTSRTLNLLLDYRMTRMAIDDARSLALFCDFENVALGVRDAKYPKFDIGSVLERLLLKGSIVVKKAYCDWDRYKSYKAPMHEAAFELIEIPHVRQSGKNSADIRMVVDALDLCYTKAHVDTFVIISGDSDFSPLVSKLRENAKTVIGIGVKSSTSDLLMSSCDEFIYYDDLVRREESSRSRRRGGRKKPADKSAVSIDAETLANAQPPTDAQTPTQAELPTDVEATVEDKRQEAIDLVVETAEALTEERNDNDVLWGSMIKQALKRRRPGFSESYYGFRSFSKLLEEAQTRGQLSLELDERSGNYIVRGLTTDD
jgi:uncharacterized protein (TIGR00288 family)